MADSTIEWTDTVWNPTTGCDKVSPGCDNCYALTMAKRLKAMGQAKYQRDGDPDTSGPGFGLATHADALDLPLRWRKPRRVFVNSMSDLFHDKVPDGFIAEVWEVMGRCPQHTFQILTKRHARMRSWVNRWADTAADRVFNVDGLPPMPRGPVAQRATYRSGRGQLFADMLESMGTPPPGAAYPTYDWSQGWRWWPRVLPNVWLGVSVENQQWADIRIPALLDTPAAVRWISAEPLLGPVDMHEYLIPDGCHTMPDGQTFPNICLSSSCGTSIDWVVVGGESGTGARPMHPDWVRSLRDQCQQAGVPFFFKQWGEWQDGSTNSTNANHLDHIIVWDGRHENAAQHGDGYTELGRARRLGQIPQPVNARIVSLVGKRRAGRLLDGREWNAYPKEPTP